MTLRTQDRQRGGGKVNLIITLLVLGAIAFSAVKIVPVYVSNYEFQDAIQSEAKFALTGYPKKSNDDIRDDIFKKAQELNIPMTRDAVQLVVDPANGNVDITVNYSITFDLAVYQWTHDFHTHADNHTI